MFKSKMVNFLGTGDATKTDDFSEQFQRGGGGSFHSKILQIMDIQKPLG